MSNTVEEAPLWKTDFLAQKANILEECSKPNWDGYGASPVDPKALDAMEALLKELGFCPFISAMPDGGVSFDLIGESEDVVVGVTPDGLVAWAGLVTGKAVGSSFMFSDRMPPDFRDLLGFLFQEHVEREMLESQAKETTDDDAR